ncbi:MAG: hypothetical protein KAH14_09515 [Clostridiales bacterium]|nr:hypothetical protein [Clostridiales bacterium]
MVKIGLLGLYLELYDECSPGMRNNVDAFYETIAQEFEKRDIAVIRHKLCRIKNEFETTVKAFENAKADAIVTLHLAYSPSLESSDVLKNTALPIFILNTTPDYDFIVNDTYNGISYNHGIHGVQDMCNLLLRNNKHFIIETGHWKNSDAIDRLCEKINLSMHKKPMTGLKVGVIGSPFDGMGDFAIDFKTLESTLGLKIITCNYEELKTYINEITDDEIIGEIDENSKKYTINIVNEDIYRSNVKTCLGVRKWIKTNKLDAFTVNFLDIDSKNGLSSVPFYEASKQMAEGKGYAGEGDVMTSGLVSSLLKLGCETSFTEIFCPDWSQNALFLSHMGEMNINLCEEKPVLHEKDYIFSDVEVNPIVFSGEFKEGKAFLVNLSPSAVGYTLIIAPIQMFVSDKISDGVRGWFRPTISIQKFLSEYSKLGGTHHSALVYGDHLETLINFGQAMNFKTIILN